MSGVFKKLLNLLPRTLSYMLNGRVPFLYKFIPFLLVPVLLSPLGRLAAVYPLVGLAGGLVVIVLSLWLFTTLASRSLLKTAAKTANRRNETGEVMDKKEDTRPRQIIEGEYQVLEVRYVEQRKAS